MAIIGAGPIGLEAALYATQSGYRVDVYEASTVAANVKHWGHVRLFSPFGLNVSSRGRNAVAPLIGAGELPGDSDILTGREFATRYLLPLGKTPELDGRIHEHTKVIFIGRSRLWKGDLIGKPERADDPFQLLLEDAEGERTVEADVVLDCSGTYGNHNHLGAGGIPCPGEREFLSADNYLLPDIPDGDRHRFAGCKTLVVGSGYSAATAVVGLAQLAKQEPGTSAIWLTRTGKKEPITRIENDQLLERDRLAGTANQLALEKNGLVEWLPSTVVRRVAFNKPSQQFYITVEQIGNGTEQGGQNKELVVDRVIANVGYKLDRSLYEELQVHECYASQGPMKLAAALLGETSTDCLSQESHGAASLENPEPGFYILGAKSYGRDSRFLLKIGIEQIRDLFSHMNGERQA